MRNLLGLFQNAGMVMLVLLVSCLFCIHPPIAGGGRQCVFVHAQIGLYATERIN